MKYDLTPVRIAIFKKSANSKSWGGCGEKGILLHCRWECKLVQPLQRTVWRFLKKLKTELPYDPAIPLQGIYPEKTIIPKYTCTPMFIAALFTISKTWKQHKCPSTDEWIKKMWYILQWNITQPLKKRRNIASCSNMDGPRDYHSKWSKSDRERQISYDINLYMESRYKSTYLQNKQTHGLWKQTYSYWRGNVVGRDKLGVWDYRTLITQ